MLAAGLSYRESGPADGPVALLLHGYPESSFMWTGVMAQRGGRVARDRAGFRRLRRLAAGSARHLAAPRGGGRELPKRAGPRALRAGRARLGRADRPALGV